MMRNLRRTAAATGVLALVGTAMTCSQTAAVSSVSYPPITSTVPFPSACTSATSIPEVSAAQVSTIEERIRAFVGTHTYGLGQCGHGLLVLTLAPGSEAFAKKVRAKFGPSVQIMVGFTVWNGNPGRSPTCGALGAPTSAPAGYSSVLHLRSRVIKVGGDLKGHVTFRSTSTLNVRVLTDQPIEVVVTKPGARRVVGVVTGFFVGTAYAPSLAPGQSQNVAIVGGTGRCDGGVGSALPPGRYDAVAEVSGVAIDGPEGGPGGQPTPTYFTPFVPIQIVR